MTQRAQSKLNGLGFKL
jgi:hypothetical protein